LPWKVSGNRSKRNLGRPGHGQLKAVNQILNKVMKATAQSVEEKVGERSEEELIDMSKNVQYSRDCLQKLAQMLMDSQADLRQASRLPRENLWR
jgi:uncharacterized membrane protein YccC